MVDIVVDGNGDFIRLPNGAFMLPRVSAAPNDLDIDHAVYVYTPESSTGEEVTVVFAENIPSGVTHATLAWYYDGEVTTHTFAVNTTDLTYALGSSANIMGRNATQSATYTIDFTNVSGRGSPFIHPTEPEGTPDVDPPDPDDVTILTAPAITTTTISEGLPFAFTAGTYTGTATVVTRYETATDIAGTGSQVVVVTGGNIPAATGGKYFRVVERVTGEGITTFLDNPSTPWKLIADVAGVQTPTPTTADWGLHTVTNITSSAARVDIVQILDDFVAVAAQWTTAASGLTDAQIDAEGAWEDMSLGSTTGGYQLWNVSDVIVGTRNYRVFDPDAHAGDKARAGRFKIRIKDADDIWSNSTTVKSVPLPETDEYYQYGDPLPMIGRSKQQFDSNILGGGGFQFFRSWGNSIADPDFLFAGQDILTPICTEDFGSLWEHPVCEGLKVGQSVQSVHIDSQNSNRILMIYSAASKAGEDEWNNQAGLYISTDKGRTFSLAQAVPDVQGSADNDPGTPSCRYMQHVFIELPGGNALGTNREYLVLVRRCPRGNASPTAAQVWKSTNGGAAWTLKYTFPVASSGEMIYEFKRNSVDGKYYIACDNGLFRTADANVDTAPTWTNLTTESDTLPAGEVYKVDTDGVSGEVWAAVKNSGLYYSSNAGDDWTVKKASYNITTFVIRPHSRTGTISNHVILIAGVGGTSRELPQRSTNGGTNWNNITTNQFAGQPEAFQSFIHDTHAYFVWHKTNPDLVFAARYQHFGRSTDGGATFEWASNNFDYNKINGLIDDPGDWTSVFGGLTDRHSLLYQDLDQGGWVIDDEVTKEVKDDIAIKATISGYMGKGNGPLVLRNGDHVARISALGNNSKGITMIHTPHASFLPKRDSDGDNINSGNGTITGLTITASGIVQHGNYRALCTTAAANGGTFTLTRPDGTTDTFTVGVQKTSQGIRFTITDGGNDYAVGDYFDITVDIMGTITVPNNNNQVSFCKGGFLVPGSTSAGYVGRWKYSLSSGGVLTGPSNRIKEIFGVGSTGVLYGCDKSSGENIYYNTTDGSAAGDWDVWATSPTPFRPIDSTWVAAVDSTHVGRLLTAHRGLSVVGKMRLFTGATSPTIKVVLNANSLIGTGYPDYSVFECGFDPIDPNIAYATLNVYGGPSIWRTENLLSDISFTAGSNTGNGTITLFTLHDDEIAHNGTYTATCTAAATNGGTFEVKYPNGTVIGNATVGSQFTGGGARFTISDGSTNFIVGDSFTFKLLPDWVSLNVYNKKMPLVPMNVFVHSQTCDLILSNHHGSFVIKPPAGHEQTHSIYDGIWNYLQDVQI